MIYKQTIINLLILKKNHLKIIVSSVFFQGFIELVTESETLRKIQVSSGVTGSFKDRPIKDWLQKHNPTELDYQKVFWLLQ